MSSIPPEPPHNVTPPEPPPYTPPQAELVSGKPDNYLVWAILATICCCLPTGIAAIVFAAQVDSKWAGGDYAGAQRASDNAKLWSLISLGVGLVASAGYFLLHVVALSAGVEHA